MNTDSNQNQSSNRYNITTTGFGYLNNICEVKPNGTPFLTCDITLLDGKPNGKDYSAVNKIYLQATVVGKDAIAMIREHFAVDGFIKSPKETVTASVRLSGLNAETFVFQNGEKAGQTGVTLKTRLLKISWLKIGQEVVEIESDRNSG